MTTPVRITAVSYLNTLPFIYGIEQRVALSSAAAGHAMPSLPEVERLSAGEGIALTLRVPALCAADAIVGDTDIALIPVAAIPLIPGFSVHSTTPAAGNSSVERAQSFIPQIITDYCIGAEGAVDTVVLLSDTPLADIRRIYLDSHSRTSVQLVRVLAREHWGIAPEWIDSADCSGELRPGEAMVAIGDKVFALTAAHEYAWRFDLAQEWHDFTGGLPFVFAAWVACTPAGLSFAPKLNGALAYGVSHIAESIPGTVNRSRDFEFEPAYRYLTESIKFDLDDRKRTAMRLFWEKIITPG